MDWKPTGREGGWWGYRLQLDSSIDVERLPLTKSGKVFARAMRKFGMIYVEDSCKTCTGIHIESLDDKKKSWSNLELGNLNAVPLDRFRVVKPLFPPFHTLKKDPQPRVTYAVSALPAMGRPMIPRR